MDAATPAAQAAVRVVGPAAVKDVADGLAGAFAAAEGGQVQLDFLRMEAPAQAAGAFMSAGDLKLSFGRVTEWNLGAARDRWVAMAPEEHVIGARGVAIVVHPRNPVSELSLAQLQAMFSTRPPDWSVFGGESRPVRRYGLAIGDRLSALFHMKVLPQDRCGPILRKRDSEEVMAAVAGDPHAIGYVDVVVAMSAGDAIRIMPLGERRAAILPNAQTMMDGTYVLSESFVLYVSPRASAAGEGFAAFVLAGHGDAVLRQHGFLPTLRSVRGDVHAAFERLYGSDVAKARASPNSENNLALALQMLQSAQTAADSDLLALLCEHAYELASEICGGQTLAFRIARVLSEKVPERRFDAALMRASMYERAYEADKSPIDGEYLIDALVEAADSGMAARLFPETAQVWTKALAVAKELESPRIESIEARLPAFAGRVESLQAIIPLTASLRANPRSSETRRQLLWLYLVELDDPAEALNYMDAAGEEAIKTNLPLAFEPLENLSKEAVLRLAEWYASLMERANPGGRELMAGRAKAYYQRFFELHTHRDDEVASRAALGLQRIGGVVPSPVPQTDQRADRRRRPTPPTLNQVLREGEEMTNLKLAEFVAANSGLRSITRQEIGRSRHITDLRPFTYLSTLRTLELHQSRRLIDLSPLARLGDLGSLTMTELAADDISSLAALNKLTSLDLRGARNLSDLSPLSRMPWLQTLDLSGCTRIRDLAPLSRLRSLSSLNLSGCHLIDDVSPLGELAETLTTLDLSGSGVKSVKPLSRMTRLRTLDLRRCVALDTEEVDWLKNQLPDCRILADERR
jgi:hypothetical protein